MKPLRFTLWLLCAHWLCHPIGVPAQPPADGNKPGAPLAPHNESAAIISPKTFARICAASPAAPVRTAAECLREFLKTHCNCPNVIIASDNLAGQPLAQAAIHLGTTADSPALARWVKEGRLTIHEDKSASDAYEIVMLDGCLVVNGASPRAVLYGVFELQDVIAEYGGVPADLVRRANPSPGLRLLHPRARGGFGGYRQSDFEFIARCGGNAAHLTHDWMAEKTLFSFVPSMEFPQAADSAFIERNRKLLRQYLDWCKLYGLDAAIWLCEVPCQGGPWVPETRRKEFSDHFPADCLSDTGTYQGKVLCMAHPLVEQAYRRMVRQFVTDFPGISALLVFTLDSSGELCDPAACPRHHGVSKLAQYNHLLALMLQEGRAVRPDLRVISVAWGWKFRSEPDYLARQAALPPGAALASLPDAEAWSFDRKLTDDLVAARALTQKQKQPFLGYDILFWGDDTVFPETKLYDFPFGIAAKLRRWHSLGADGVFDQWGTQAEYIQCNAVALRELTFHPQNAGSPGTEAWALSLAIRRFGTAAAPHVLAAWREIEAAQQIQSDHAYYWHHLRPGWAGPALKCPLTADALQAVTLQGAEPPKPHALRDYAPHRDDVSRARVLGSALQAAADHFAGATVNLEAANPLLPSNGRSALDHWYSPETGAPPRLTPRDLIEQQLIAVRLQEKTQRRMGRFFKAFALAKSLPPKGTAQYEEAMLKLQRLNAEDKATKPWEKETAPR